jgi:hypothetical protein
MKMLLKSSFTQRRAWLLLAALLLACFGCPAFGQLPITNYNEFASALKSGTNIINGFEVITNFQTNAYISLEGDQTIQITRNVLIDGFTNGVVFDGTSSVRIFTVATNTTLILKNLQVINGSSTNGGAIYNNGTLIISNCIISGNSATNISGTNGVANTSGGNGVNGGNGGSSAGGAIYSRGPLSIFNSVLGTNSALGGSGGTGGTGGNSLLFGGNGGNGGSGGSARGAAVYSTGSSNTFIYTEFFNNTCTAGSAGSGAASGTGSFVGIGGEGADGGAAAGGAVYVTGPVYVAHCVFAFNTVTAGAAGADLSGNNNGYNGGSAEGGGLYVPNTVTNAHVENSVFFQNTCTAGVGGTATGDFDGGNGGSALGGGLASAAALVTVRSCTLASNTLSAGTNGAGGLTNGENGVARGWDISETGGVLKLSGSIISGGTNVTPNRMPNAYQITDAGYNVSSDASLVQAFTNTLTNVLYVVMLDTLVSGYGNVGVGPTNVNGPPFETEDIEDGSIAAGFVPGVPGVSFPATDELGMPRGSPASAGAFELNPITIDSNAPPPTVTIASTETNAMTDAGGTVTFSVSSSSTDAYTNALGYQWQLNGTNLPDNPTFNGSTSSNLTITHVTPADEGMYQVVVGVSVLEGITTVTGFSLVITNPVKITAQPASKINVPVGSAVTFSVGVTGSPPYSFQWYMGTTQLTDGTNADGTVISGATSNILTIDPALTNDAGKYSVVVANDYNTNTSALATLSVNPVDKTKPTIAFSSPAAGVRTNNPVITGTASDIAQVTNVIYWVTNINAGNVTTISGTASLSSTGTTTKTWSITNALLPGTNHVTVQSVDFSGNESTFVTREFFYEVTAPFTVLIEPEESVGAVTGVASIKGDPAPSNGAALYIGEGYTLTAKAVLPWRLENWMQGANIAGTNATLNFIMESNLVVTANFTTNLAPIVEKTKPSVTITSPKANSRSPAPVLSGKASDAVAVLNVAYWLTNLNNGVITATSGTAVLSNGTNWSITNALLPGTNILSVRSSNYAGLSSATASVAFFYQMAVPIQLLIEPQASVGTVTGVASVKGDPAPPAQTSLYVGEGYKLTAKPAKNWLLVNWMEGANIAGTNATLTFIMESNLVVTANFESNSLVGAVARYDGIFYPAVSQANVTNSGLIYNLMLTSNGVYSGKMYLEGASYPLTGLFNSAGKAAETIDRSASAGENLTLEMNILSPVVPRQITGSVRGANWNATNLNLYAAAAITNKVSQYTMLLPPDTNAVDAPPGYGYALITNMAGMIHISGALSDGTSFTGLVALINELDQFPVYASLTNKGLLLGELSLDATSYATVPAGGLLWFKPPLPNALYSAGFSAVLEVEGSPWTNSTEALSGLFSTNEQLTISGGGLVSNVECNAHLITSNTFGTSPDFASGSVNPANGLMTLTFSNASGEKVTAKGTVLQNANLGGGFFMGATNSGTIILAPASPATE